MFRHAQRFRLPALAGLMLAALGVVTAGAVSQDPTEKSIVVTVVDKNNRPVKDVPAQAFAVREDNLDREVVRVERATSPVAVVLLADTTTSFIPFSRDLRVASESFFKAFLEKNPGAQAALWEFGGADIPIVRFTNEFTALADGSKKLFPKGTLSAAQADAVAAGAATARGQNVIASNLLEAIIGSSKELAKREEERRIIVSLNADVSVEASSVQGPKVEEEVVKARATWFAVSIQAQVNNGPLRDNVMNVLVPRSGGTRYTIVSIQALEQELVNVADIIASQYVVTYKRPSGTPKAVQVGLRVDPAVGLRASTALWAPK